MPHDTEKCKEIFAKLSEYLDLDLPAGDCERIEEHLAGCPPCVEFMDSLRKSVELCHGYDSGARPAPLSAEARTELEKVWRQMIQK